MIKRIFFLLLISFACISLNAQIQFDKKFDLGIVSASRKTVEIPGGYVSAGYNVPDTTTYVNNLLVKIDLNGDTIKTMYIAPHDST